MENIFYNYFNKTLDKMIDEDNQRFRKELEEIKIKTNKENYKNTFSEDSIERIEKAIK